MLTTEEKKSLFKKFGGSVKNAGNTEAQIAMFSEEINKMTEPCKKGFGKIFWQHES